MELFLVKGIIESRRYMNDHDEREEDIRLVRAIDEEAAKDKYKKFWDDKSEAYFISYYAKVVSVTGVIE